MSEWWTYGLSDFVMFSPITYWRLVEQYNRESWPAQLLGLAGGFALLWLAASPGPGRSRALASLLSAAWLWVAWAFLWRRYASINLAGSWWATAFAFQGVMMLGLGLSGSGRSRRPAGRGRVIGWSIAGFAVLLYPVIGLAMGRRAFQTEIFGLMPDPTALATLGLLLGGVLGYSMMARLLLCLIPALSLAAGWATLWAMTQ